MSKEGSKNVVPVNRDGHHIDKIIGIVIGQDNKTYYHVQWTPTWEPLENLLGCDELIRNFWMQQNVGVFGGLISASHLQVKQEPVELEESSSTSSSKAWPPEWRSSSPVDEISQSEAHASPILTRSSKAAPVGRAQDCIQQPRFVRDSEPTVDLHISVQPLKDRGEPVIRNAAKRRRVTAGSVRSDGSGGFTVPAVCEKNGHSLIEALNLAGLDKKESRVIIQKNVVTRPMSYEEHKNQSENKSKVAKPSGWTAWNPLRSVTIDIDAPARSREDGSVLAADENQGIFDCNSKIRSEDSVLFPIVLGEEFSGKESSRNNDALSHSVVSDGSDVDAGREKARIFGKAKRFSCCLCHRYIPVADHDEHYKAHESGSINNEMEVKETSASLHSRRRLGVARSEPLLTVGAALAHSLEAARLRCNSCSSTFTSTSDLEQHVFVFHRRHMQKKPRSGPDSEEAACACGSAISSEDDLREHRLSCPFKPSNRARRHVSMCHPSNVRSLKSSAVGGGPAADVSFIKGVIADVEASTHSVNDSLEPSGYRCAPCNTYYTSKKILRLHCKRFHKAWWNEKAQLFVGCAVCGKMFKKPALLKIHLTLHQGATGQLYKCCVCERRFSTLATVQSHLIMHEFNLGLDEAAASDPSKDIDYEDRRLSISASSSFAPDVAGDVGQIISSGARCSPAAGTSNLKGQIFRCYVCPSAYSSKKALRRHSKKHIRTRTFVEARKNFAVKSFSHGMPKKAFRIIDPKTSEWFSAADPDLSDGKNSLPDENVMPVSSGTSFMSEAGPRCSLSKGMMSSDRVGMSFPCQLCSKVFAEKKALQCHLTKFHRQRYPSGPGVPSLLLTPTPDILLPRSEAIIESVEVASGASVAESPPKNALLATLSEESVSLDAEEDKLFLRPHQCPLCASLFRTRKNLVIHTERQHKIDSATFAVSVVHPGIKVESAVQFTDYPYFCPYCLLGYSKLAVLQNHTLRVHSAYYKPSDEQKVREDEASRHKSVQLTQPVVTKGEETNEDVKTISSENCLPNATPSKYKLYHCPWCPKKYHEQGPLTRHIRHVHDESHPKQSHLDRDSASALEEQVGVVPKMASGGYKCPYCETQRARISDIYYHIQQMHKKVKLPRKKYAPKFPGSVDTKSNKDDPLELDGILHVSEGDSALGNDAETVNSVVDKVGIGHLKKPDLTRRVCKQCGKTYLGRPCNHMRWCGRAKPPAAQKRLNTLMSCQKCGKAFSSQVLLIAHKRMHRNDYKPDGFCCTLCDAKFSWKASLKRHFDEKHFSMDKPLPTMV